MDDEEYVTKKLNEAFFSKLQTYGAERGKAQEDDAPPTREAVNRSKSVRERRRSSVANLGEGAPIKITKQVTKPKRRNSSIQDERSIHDAYHTILNEFKRVSIIFGLKLCPQHIVFPGLRSTFLMAIKIYI